MPDSIFKIHESRNTNSIGVFDSGIGGLTVFAEVEKLLPRENLIYLGDTARVPYGTKSRQTVQRFAWEDAQFLIEQNVKLIVAACNTVSALALSFLKERLDLPLLGVIEPAAQEALERSKTGRMGVIGTRATVESRAYEKAFQRLAPSAKIWSRACPLFVPLAEENWTDEPETLQIAEKYLEPLLEQKIDTLILGCTHYPLLRSVIQKVMGPEVMLIDSAQSTAAACLEILKEKNLLGMAQKVEPRLGESATSFETTRGATPPRCYIGARAMPRFYVTDEPERFRKIGEKFLGHPISHVERVNLESDLSRATAFL